jgi:hypothetical protein
MPSFPPLMVCFVVVAPQNSFEYVCRITSQAVCLLETTVLYWRRSYLSSHVSDAPQRERDRDETPTTISFSLCVALDVATCRGEDFSGGGTPSGLTGRSHATPETDAIQFKKTSFSC